MVVMNFFSWVYDELMLWFVSDGGDHDTYDHALRGSGAQPSSTISCFSQSKIYNYVRYSNNTSYIVNTTYGTKISWNHFWSYVRYID